MGGLGAIALGDGTRSTVTSTVTRAVFLAVLTSQPFFGRFTKSTVTSTVTLLKCPHGGGSKDRVTVGDGRFKETTRVRSEKILLGERFIGIYRHLPSPVVQSPFMARDRGR